jgi:hypothetical protein
LLLYSFGGGVFILFLGNWYFHLLLLLFGYTHTHMLQLKRAIERLGWPGHCRLHLRKELTRI